ncbi:MAG: alpha/beta fold hydrolase [Shimia sp.]
MPDFHATDGTRLHYDDDGEGPVVLALSGLTRTGRDFDYVAPYLDGIRLIRMDYRGRGRSARPGPDGYTIAQEGADALALLDHLGLARAAILGTSRGGLIAMALAATAKERLTGVCLVDIGPEIAAEGLAAIAEYLGRPPAFRNHAEAAEARARLLPGFEDVPPDRWVQEALLHYRSVPGGLANDYDPRLREAVLAGGAQPAPDLWPLFDALEGLPLALIRGVNSNLLTAATADEMARRRPDMRRAEVPGRGHVPFLDEPESRAALKDWIALL